MLVVAKSAVGHEFMYSARSAHRVPKASANQIWFVHEVGPYDDAYVYGETQSFSKRNGSVYERS